MSRRVYIIIAFVVAIVATIIGWSQSMNYKQTPFERLALWFPTVVVTSAGSVKAVVVSLIQFPLFAAAFAFCITRWRVARVLAVLLLTYGLSVGWAYVIVIRRMKTRVDHVLQCREPGMSVAVCSWRVSRVGRRAWV